MESNFDAEKRITVFTGHYGSGKTEVAINYALRQKEKLYQTEQSELMLVDLDFVNPYFRSREAREFLNQQGIKVVASAEEQLNTDIPAFSPGILAAFQNPVNRVVVDLGGDEIGARAIGRFRNQIKDDNYELLFVINPYRPFTSNSQEVESLLHKIEGSSRLKVTALVSNPNLLGETTVDDIISGHKAVLAMSQELGMAVKFITVDAALKKYSGLQVLQEPVMYLSRLMLKPWED